MPSLLTNPAPAEKYDTIGGATLVELATKRFARSHRACEQRPEGSEELLADDHHDLGPA